MTLFKSFSILIMRSNFPPLELPVPPSPSGSVTERDSRWYRLGLEPLPEARLAPRVRSFSLEAPRPKPCMDLLVFVPEFSISPSKSLSSWSEDWLLEDELPPFLKCIRGFVVDSFSFWTDSFSFLLQSAKIFWACPPRPNKLETYTQCWLPWFCWYISRSFCKLVISFWSWVTFKLPGELERCEWWLSAGYGRLYLSFSSTISCFSRLLGFNVFSNSLILSLSSISPSVSLWSSFFRLSFCFLNWVV